MFAALYGELIRYAWHDPASEHDAYQLFYQRSLAMGWLEEGGVPGLWGMNDAGAVAEERPLPVQPFLRCAWDTTARIGTVRLSALQALLPGLGHDAASRDAAGRPKPSPTAPLNSTSARPCCSPSRETASPPREGAAGFAAVIVYPLWHVGHQNEAGENGSTVHVDRNGVFCDESAGDDVKLLGIYSTPERAAERLRQARLLPGFRDEPDCFSCDPYELDEDEWTEGFARVRPGEQAERVRAEPSGR
ncbi:hypothetical protein [Streptomyces sp. NPDC005435]|uniref:DUF7336 domain-containing protein n=1 Tax=Streptomyces sp. NPDC005435 TaxID=3154464 RepID=UPI003451EC66